MSAPQTARELVMSLPTRLKVDEAQGVDIIIHLRFTGDTGGQFTVKVKDNACLVEEGLKGEPKCEVDAKATTYEDIELGRTNAQMAFFMGKLQITDIGVMLKFINLFERVA